MGTLRLELPEDVAAFLAEAGGGDLNSARAHDFLRGLIADEMTKVERLRGEVQKGLDSADSPYSIDEVFEQARAKSQSRAA